MKVTCLQLGMADRSKEKNIEHALAMLDQAPESDLFLLPEIWPCGFFSFDRYQSESESEEGPTVALFREKARRLQRHILMGSFVERNGGNFYNTTLLLGPGGETVARYRKIHLFGYRSREKMILTPGTEIVTVKTPWGESGFSTCYDLRFPELYRRMVDRGAKFFLIPSAWPLERREAWVLFNRARAHENLSFLISCNCAGANGGARYAGASMIIDPLGRVLAEGGSDEQTVSADIDPGFVDEVRGEFPALADRVLG